MFDGMILMAVLRKIILYSEYAMEKCKRVHIRDLVDFERARLLFYR